LPDKVETNNILQLQTSISFKLKHI